MADGRTRTDDMDERGSGAIAVLIFAVLFLALAALVVDGGMAISKRERAADLAEQAARYAAQDIDVEALRNATGTEATAPINFQNCTGDVRRYLQTAGLSTGDVSASGCDDPNAQEVTVHVQVTYHAMLSAFLFDKDFTARASASATNLSGD